jgi:hypothetical protein
MLFGVAPCASIVVIARQEIKRLCNKGYPMRAYTPLARASLSY